MPTNRFDQLMAKTVFTPDNVGGLKCQLMYLDLLV